MTLTPSSIIHISYPLICSWKIYYGELPVNITLVHTAALEFVSIKLSMYLSVVISVLQQTFILSYNILLHVCFFFRIRKLETVSEWGVVRKALALESGKTVSMLLCHSVLCDLGKVTFPLVLSFAICKMWLLDKIFSESLSRYWDSRAGEWP